MHEGPVDPDSFLSLLTDDCCQLTVANWQPICCNIIDYRLKIYCHHQIIINLTERQKTVQMLVEQLA